MDPANTMDLTVSDADIREGTLSGFASALIADSADQINKTVEDYKKSLGQPFDGYVTCVGQTDPGSAAGMNHSFLTFRCPYDRRGISAS